MVSSITIADTTFPTEIGKRYVWDWTYPAQYDGYKVGFIADSINQGIYDTHQSLIVNCTVYEYLPTSKLWVIAIPDEFYLAANKTQDYLNFSVSWLNKAFASPFVIPTPINLTLVAEACVPAGWDYSIDGNTITVNTTHFAYEWTFNSGGFMTIADSRADGVLNEKFVLEGSGSTPGIPFGMFFLIPTVSSIAIVVIIVKRRQLKAE